MSLSVVFTRYRFPLNLIVSSTDSQNMHLDSVHIFLTQNVFSVHLFGVMADFWEVGVFACGCESQLNLAAVPNTEKHVCSHMEQKPIQFNQCVQYVCTAKT